MGRELFYLHGTSEEDHFDESAELSATAVGSCFG